MNYRATVVARLVEAGCYKLESLNAFQELWHSPLTGRRFLVESSILSKKTANQILKDAGCATIP